MGCMKRASVLLALYAVVASNDAIKSNALRLNSASPKPKEKSQRQKKGPLRQPLQTSLKSIARAARDGTSTWGDHFSSFGRQSSSNKARSARQHQSISMKQSSSIFISKLHKKIQTKQQQYPNKTPIQSNLLKRRQYYASDEEIVDQNSNDYPKEHFVQEILAVIVSGAAATSAFVAVSTGAFIATLAVVVGSIFTVLFHDDEDGVDATLIETGIGEDDDYFDQDEEREEDCDITGNDLGVAGENKSLEQHEEFTIQPMKKLTNYKMDELRRCYEGKPNNMPLRFPLRHGDDGMCIVYTDSDERATIEEDKADCSDRNMPVEDAVMNALEDICSTGDCEKIVPSVDHPESNKRINVLWHDQHIADGSNNPVDTDKPKGKVNRKIFRRTNGIDISGSQQRNDYTESLTDAEQEGALLLSQSFRVAASAFGVVADAVRFTGETAAVCTGGAARLAGGVFRLSGFAVNSLGSAIEHGSSKKDTISQAKDLNLGKQITKRRKVAGESVRLLGESIEQVADSLLLAGSATERVAFAAASIAEGAVRFVSDMALSASDMFAKESLNALDSGLKPIEGRVTEKETRIHIVDTHRTTLAMNETGLDESSLIKNQKSDDSNDQTYIFLWAMNNVGDIMADTLGVRSLAPELLGVLVVCYLGSLILLRQNRSKGGQLLELGKPPEKPSHISVPKERFRAQRESVTHDTHNDTDSHTTLTVDTTKKEKRRMHSFFLKRVVKGIFFVVLSPMKLFALAACWVLSLVFNRQSILLLLYFMSFLFLSRSSQYKAAVIKRKAELLGYHGAIQSIGSPMSSLESSMWLNTILNNVWRVDNNATSDSFGGFEPYLSSLAAASLIDSLSGSYKKPNGVAHVSFHSFTFGQTPPMLRGIRVLKVDSDLSALFMTIDVGILMEAELLLDISPSSLDYKMVPTTTLSINSLDAELQLDVSLKSIPDYPYISSMNVSLSQVPDFSLRIEPQSQSGLKGVDFGSFPLISKWIKESIVESLREYVTPKYISIDIPAWLNGNQRIVSYF